ncbi:hypothetical protein [Chitinophaga niabensis]|uniref:Lipocalin-like domain-containing protein n=1 Tax=Chitinophaga niabensis TaxID=536979 RepID=A0A1N6FYW9_9BACT|nr:hypothetical protein [Chitinophaga niabensis]SIO00464.1 hypothetical protein SAMN04488055_2489 [Chitinophaga niabensis]
MKKIILFLLILGGAAACKKENMQEVNANNLQGTWEATKKIYIYYENDKEIEREEATVQPKKDVFVFAGDSLLLYRDDKRTRDRYTFTLNGGNLDVRESNYTTHFKLKWYQDTQMSIAQEETDQGSTGVKTRYIQETVFVKK